MKKLKVVVVILLIVLVIIQFIRPARNEGEAQGANTIAITDEVKTILQNSCFDCHSNHTNYPWYNNVQPLAWWLSNHVNEAKEEINFSEFNTYSLKRKIKKMKEIKEQIEEDEMPLSSYTLIHRGAVLSSEQKEILLKWVEETKNKLAFTISHD